MKATTSAWLLGMAAALTACGGGGGGGGSSSAVPTGGSATVPADGSSTPNAPAPAVAATPVTDVPAPTYASASVEAGVFRVLNDERSRCGFGEVAQNPQLDTAAGWHSAYLQTQWLAGVPASGHLQESGRGNFTAATHEERASRAGYTGAVDKCLAFHFLAPSQDTGNAVVRTMLASVYHQMCMLDGNRDAGASVARVPMAVPLDILTWMTGTAPGVPLQDNSEVITYPCEGTTGVQPVKPGENPDPFNGLGLEPVLGHPIYVSAPAGQTLRLTAATVIDVNGASWPVALYHAEQDPQQKLTASQAFVVPRTPLAEGSRYSVQVQYTSNGVPFSRQFSFSTGRS
ncbi:hypothetical protein MW290_11340 [Aquincola tertiaricarbonis]|uniref:SCP domain-containing protein n=1 Tax=Aquincola tertiaricarbonis TaxID=391953 RepID=A0ABY4RZT8_AQUTE|nr:hypothetical protein [Aquincola tertiaricarbonis]URI06503.1 hypothetical protein MW290_11340 [Aquincola tertiaricarbonis]